MANLHAVSICTRGRIPCKAVGMASSGWLTIKIEEVSLPGYANRGYREERKKITKKQKCIKVTVIYCGEKYVTTKCVDDHVKISMRDIEVNEIDGKITVDIKTPILT